MSKFRFIGIEELLNEKIPKRKYKHVKFIKKTNCIIVDGYEIDLDRCKTSKSCLDWIHQLHEKIWFTPEMHEEFIDILFDHIPKNLWAFGMMEEGE